MGAPKEPNELASNGCVRRLAGFEISFQPSNAVGWPDEKRAMRERPQRSPLQSMAAIPQQGSCLFRKYSTELSLGAFGVLSFAILSSELIACDLTPAKLRLITIP